MVKFRVYFNTMVALKPEWRKAYVNYPMMKKLTDKIKAEAQKSALRDGDHMSITNDPDAITSFLEEHKAADIAEAALVQEEEGNEDGQREEDDEDFEQFRSPRATTLGRSPPAFGRSPTSMTVLKSPAVQAVKDTTPLLAFDATGRPLPLGGNSTRFVVTPVVRRASSLSPATSPANEMTFNFHVGMGEREPTWGPAGGVLPALPSAEAELEGAEDASALPQMLTREGMALSLLFEDTLIAEVKKAQAFAARSLRTFIEFFESHKKIWRDKNHSLPQTKDNMKYLNQEVEHLVQFCETCELAVKKLLKHYLQVTPIVFREALAEDVLLGPLLTTLQEVGGLKEVLAAFWATLFNDDISAAKRKLLRKSASVRQGFRAGFCLAMILTTILYAVHVFFELEPDPSVIENFDTMFPIIRLVVTFNFFFVCWGWVLWVYEKRRINYLYVFELSQTASASWMQVFEYGVFQMWLSLLFAILYVRSELARTNCYRTNGIFEHLAPFIMPVYLVIWVLMIAFPLRHVFEKSQKAFFKVLYRCMKLPFGDVSFIDFFVADWGTSLVISCGDLLYFGCYYARTVGGLGVEECHMVRTNYYFPISAIPYLWRACQTLKMYKKTDNFVHVINFGKYLSCIITFVCMWWFALAPSPAMNILTWITHVGSQLYCFIWDILMDWGWVRGRKRGRMFPKIWVYIAAGIFDFIARMFWIPAQVVFSVEMEPRWVHFIQALLEVFRRAMWSIFRVENENVNNLETYRSIDFVPHAVL